MRMGLVGRSCATSIKYRAACLLCKGQGFMTSGMRGATVSLNGNRIAPIATATEIGDLSAACSGIPRWSALCGADRCDAIADLMTRGRGSRSYCRTGRAQSG